MTETELLQTVFHDWHVEHGGRMVEFGGWHMPVQYSTIVDEHQAVRNQVGLFDIAHMGRLRFDGPDACALLDRLLTNDVTKLEPGQVRYSLVCREDGGILDDVLVYRFESHYLLVVNASNRTKIVNWIEQQQGGLSSGFRDLTTTHAMLALQGPRGIDVMRALDCAPAAGLQYYTAVETTVAGIGGTVSRTGYTGEDGFELIVANDDALPLLSRIVEAGQASNLVPCGLGCRDTLRLEAAMPLYGHELSESIDPLTAGLSFAVKLKAGDFIGRSTVQTIKESGPKKKRVGLQLEGRRIAREGATILAEGSLIGEVTSGTFSPTLQASIAMGYVEPGHAGIDTRVVVDIRGKEQSARVVPIPFYRRDKSDSN